MGCCSQLCHVVMGQRCTSRTSHPLQSRRRPIAYQSPSHTSSASNFCSLADELDQQGLSITQTKIVEILPEQSDDSGWDQEGLDVTALPVVLPAVVPRTLGQLWPSTSCSPESRSWEQLDLFPPRVQKSCSSRFWNSTSECSSSFDRTKYNIWQNFDSLLTLPRSERYKHRQGCSPHTASELLTLQGGTVSQLPTKRLDSCQKTIPLIQSSHRGSQVPPIICQQVVTGKPCEAEAEDSWRSHHTVFIQNVSIAEEQWQHFSNAVTFCTLWHTRYVNKWVSV